MQEKSWKNPVGSGNRIIPFGRDFLSHPVQPPAQSMINIGKEERQFLSFPKDIMHGKKTEEKENKVYLEKKPVEYYHVKSSSLRDCDLFVWSEQYSEIETFLLC